MPNRASGTDDNALREEVRNWLKSNLPGDWKERQQSGGPHVFVDLQRFWFDRLKSAGYLVPHWPVEWGGGGFSAQQQAVIHQEMARAGAPRLQLYFVSLYHTAATLFRMGTEEQRQRFLEGILGGAIWCQGFSEPDAGSDLGSLRTRAQPTEGGYCITGQKVWTSIGTHADWCLLLARTGDQEAGSRSLTLFAMAMDSQGLTVRPIRQSTGVAEFCELFLDEVFIPNDNVIGGMNNGWAAANATLATERGLTTLELSYRLSAAAEQVERSLALGHPLGNDVGEAELILGRVRSEINVLLAFAEQFLDRATDGLALPAEASALKLLYSEVLQSSLDRFALLAGLDSYRAGELLLGAGWETGHWALDFINSGSWTIAGGASEVLRDVLSEQLLGLPRKARK